MDIRVAGFHTKTRRDGKTVDWVSYYPAHGAQSMITNARVSDLMPPAHFEEGRDKAGSKMFHMRAVWSQIEPHYRAWKDGFDMPETGTALRAWPGVTESQVFELNRAGIKSVEDLANCGDGGLDKVRLPNARALRAEAMKFVEAVEVNKTADALAELQAKMAEKDEQLAAAMALLEEMQQAPTEEG